MVSTVLPLRSVRSYEAPRLHVVPRVYPRQSYPVPPPVHLREPQDRFDMLDPRWECPAPPKHPHLSAMARGLNRSFMRPLLGLGRVAMGSLLKSNGFHRGYIHTRAGDLNYFDGVGTGPLPPIVLVLGIGGTTTDYLKMLKRLKNDYSRVIAVDLPGHGYSKTPDVPMDDAAVVGAVGDALNHLLPPGGKAILLGHSLGGYIAARYAAAHPERLSGLVLAEPTGAPFSNKELTSFNHLYALETRKKARTVIHNAFYNDAKDNFFIVSAAWARLTSPVARQMIRSDLFTNHLRPETLGGLQMPVLLIWGQDDHLLPTGHYFYFANNLPVGTRFVLPPNINHNNAAVGPPEIVNPVIAFSHSLMEGNERANPWATAPADPVAAVPITTPPAEPVATPPVDAPTNSTGAALASTATRATVPLIIPALGRASAVPVTVTCQVKTRLL